MKKKNTQLDSIMKKSEDALNICLEYSNTIIEKDPTNQDITFMKVYDIYRHLREASEIFRSIKPKRNQLDFESLSLNKFFKLLSQQAKTNLAINLPEIENDL